MTDKKYKIYLKDKTEIEKSASDLKVGDIVKIYQQALLAPIYKKKFVAKGKKGKKIVADVEEEKVSDTVKETYIDYTEVDIPVVSFQGKKYTVPMLVPTAKEETKLQRIKKGDMGDQVKRNAKKDFTVLEGEKEERNILVKRGQSILNLQKNSKNRKEYEEGMKKIMEPLLQEKYKVELKKFNIIENTYALMKVVSIKKGITFELYKKHFVKIIEKGLLRRLNPPFNKRIFLPKRHRVGETAHPLKRLKVNFKDVEQSEALKDIDKLAREVGLSAIEDAIKEFEKSDKKSSPKKEKEQDKIAGNTILKRPYPLSILLPSGGFVKRYIEKSYKDAIIAFNNISKEDYFKREYKNYKAKDYDTGAIERLVEICRGEITEEEFADSLYEEIYNRSNKDKLNFIDIAINDFIYRRPDISKAISEGDLVFAKNNILPFIKQKFPLPKKTIQEKIQDPNIEKNRKDVVEFIKQLKKDVQDKKQETFGLKKKSLEKGEVSKKDKKFNKKLAKELKEEHKQIGKGKKRESDEESIESKSESEEESESIEESKESVDEDELFNEMNKISSEQDEADEELLNAIEKKNAQNEKLYGTLYKTLLNYLAKNYKSFNVKQNSVAKFLNELKKKDTKNVVFDYKGYKSLEGFLYENLKRYVQSVEKMENGVVIGYKLVDNDEKEFPRKLNVLGDEKELTLVDNILTMVGNYSLNYYFEYQQLEKLEKEYKNFDYLSKYVKIFPNKNIKTLIVDFITNPKGSASILFPSKFISKDTKIDEKIIREECEKYMQLHFEADHLKQTYEQFLEQYQNVLEKEYKNYLVDYEKFKNLEQGKIVGRKVAKMFAEKQKEKSPAKQISISKIIEEKVFKQSENNLEKYFKTISRIMLYLGTHFKKNAKMFHKKLEKGVYKLTDLANVSVEEFLPELFLNAKGGERGFVAFQIIMDEMNINMQMLINKLKAIRDPTKRFPKITFPKYSNIDEFVVGDIREICEDKNIPLEKLVIKRGTSVKKGKNSQSSFYCFNQDELYNNFKKNNFKNKYNGQEFDKEFVEKFIKIYSDKSLEKIVASEKKKSSPLFPDDEEPPKKLSPKTKLPKALMWKSYFINLYKKDNKITLKEAMKKLAKKFPDAKDITRENIRTVIDGLTIPNFRLTFFKWDDDNNEWVSQGIKDVSVKLDGDNNIYNLHIGDYKIFTDDIKKGNDKLTFMLKENEKDAKKILFAIKKDLELAKILKNAKTYNEKQIKKNMKEIGEMMEHL